MPFFFFVHRASCRDQIRLIKILDVFVFVFCSCGTVECWYFLMTNGRQSIGENVFVISLMLDLGWDPENEACCTMLIFLFRAKESISRCFPVSLGMLMCQKLPSLDRWWQQVSEDADWLKHNPSEVQISGRLDHRDASRTWLARLHFKGRQLECRWALIS